MSEANLKRIASLNVRYVQISIAEDHLDIELNSQSLETAKKVWFIGNILRGKGGAGASAMK